MHKNVKEKLNENQRGLFLMDIVAKVYEKVKNRQNEKIHSNMSQMQTAGRKQRSSMDNIRIVSSIIEKRRQEEQNTYLMCADAVKCFEKLWLKDCLIEMKELGYSSNNIKILYETYKKTDIKIETPFGEISSMEIKEVVKQGSTYGPIMCCTATSNVKDISEKVEVKYGEILIGMSIFMDDIAAIGGAEDIRKCIRNCRKMETEMKMEYGLTKTNIVVIKTGKGITEKIEEEVRAGKVKETDKVRYLGMVINSEGNLKDHIRLVETKTNNISKEIKAIGSKSQAGSEEMKMKIKLFETCFMPAIIHGLEVWGRITATEMKEISKIQVSALKQILHLPKSTPNIGI